VNHGSLASKASIYHHLNYVRTPRSPIIHVVAIMGLLSERALVPLGVLVYLNKAGVFILLDDSLCLRLTKCKLFARIMKGNAIVATIALDSGLSVLCLRVLSWLADQCNPLRFFWLASSSTIPPVLGSKPANMATAVLCANNTTVQPPDLSSTRDNPSAPTAL